MTRKMYEDLESKSTITATKFIGPLEGNADTATTATKLGTASYGATLRIWYLNNGEPTQGTQLYSKNHYINGTNYAVIRSSNSNLPSIYAPIQVNYANSTASGNGNDLLISTTGAPVWVPYSESSTGNAITSISISSTGVTASKDDFAKTVKIGTDSTTYDSSSGVITLPAYPTLSSLGAAAASHTHAAGDVTSGTFDVARIPDLSAGKITSGTFAAARIPTATASAIGGIKIGTGLSISSGVVSVSYGTSSTTACKGDDSRLSDARTPVAHASTSTTYGVGSTTNYGHLKVGSNITVSSGTISLSSSNVINALGYTPGTGDAITYRGVSSNNEKAILLEEYTGSSSDGSTATHLDYVDGSSYDPVTINPYYSRISARQFLAYANKNDTSDHFLLIDAQSNQSVISCEMDAGDVGTHTINMGEYGMYIGVLGRGTSASESSITIYPASVSLSISDTTNGTGTVTFTADSAGSVIGVGKVSLGTSGSIASANPYAVTGGAVYTALQSYLKLSGGTMTGVLTLKGSMYEDAYNGALNANNSDIYGLNSIYTADKADSSAEGIHFYRSSTTVDTIWVKDGNYYVTPNRTLGQAGTSYKIYHEGNTYNNKVTVDSTVSTIMTTSNTALTLASKSYVDTAISGIPTPMQFKGSVGTNGTITTLPAAAVGNTGYVYKAITAHAASTNPVYPEYKVGDTLISDGSAWTVIPSGDEPSGTVTSIATSNDITGGTITTSGTIKHADITRTDTTSIASPAHSGTFTAVDSVTTNARGHVTAVNVKKVTLPAQYSLPLAASGTRGGVQIGYSESGTNYAVKLSSEKMYVTVPWTDTKNTAGSTNSASKLFLIGATEQSANPQTYSNSKVYATDGALVSTSVEAVHKAAPVTINVPNNTTRNKLITITKDDFVAHGYTAHLKFRLRTATNNPYENITVEIHWSGTVSNMLIYSGNTTVTGSAPIRYVSSYVPKTVGNDGCYVMIENGGTTARTVYLEMMEADVPYTVATSPAAHGLTDSNFNIDRLEASNNADRTIVSSGRMVTNITGYADGGANWSYYFYNDYWGVAGEALASGVIIAKGSDGKVYTLKSRTDKVFALPLTVARANSAFNSGANVGCQQQTRNLGVANLTSMTADTTAVSAPLYVRGSLDSNGYFVCDGHYSSAMANGYTWVQIGSFARAVGNWNLDASTVQHAITLDANGKVTHVDGKAVVIPTLAAAAGTNIGSVGTPSVTVSTSGTTTTFTFNYLKGAKGDTGATGPQGPTGPAGSYTWTTTGSGNAVTAVSESGGTVTVTKGTTFLTSQWTANLITGASATAQSNAANTTTNSIFLNLVENSTVRNSHNIVGSGGTTVACDANGKITITSPSLGTGATNAATGNHTHKYAGSSSAGGSASTIAATSATTTKAYLLGTTLTANGNTTPCFDTGVYLDTTAGYLTATRFCGTLQTPWSVVGVISEPVTGASDTEVKIWSSHMGDGNKSGTLNLSSQSSLGNLFISLSSAYSASNNSTVTSTANVTIGETPVSGGAQTKWVEMGGSDGVQNTGAATGKLWAGHVYKGTTEINPVSFSRSLTSGTKIGTITIDGTGTDIYCNSGTLTKASGVTTAANQVALWNGTGTDLKTLAQTSLAPGVSLAASGSSGTTLSASTWYTLTVGASTCTFKTAPNTWTALAKGTASAAGTAGYAPAPPAGTQGGTSFLSSAATWVAQSSITAGACSGNSATATAMSIGGSATNETMPTASSAQLYKGSINGSASTAVWLIETYLSGNYGFQRATSLADASEVCVRTRNNSSTWGSWTYSYAVWKA